MSTQGDLDVWADLVARSLRAAGARPGDRVHNAYGYGLFTGGLGAHAGAERLGCTVVPVSGGMTERQVMLIQDFEPDVIMVTPSYLLALVEEMERQGIDPTSTSLRLAVLGAEPWTDDMRREIETRLAVDAVDIYGLSEVMGPGVACEAVETKDGPHIWEDHFLPEIVDPITGDVLADGEEGELVFTTLTREAMPVVRYRTRDLTRLLPGTARPAMRRIRKITGRSDDMMIVRGVNVFPTQIEEVILRLEPLTPHFQCVLTRPGPMDELTVRVERREDIAPDVGHAAGRPARRSGQGADRCQHHRRGARPVRHRAQPGQDAPHHRRTAPLTAGAPAPLLTAGAPAPSPPAWWVGGLPGRRALQRLRRLRRR